MQGHFLCHPPANVPCCCSCHHWGGGGLIRSQLAALLMRKSHRSLHGQESGMSSLVLPGGFRAGGFAATSCPWIRRSQTSFQRDWKGLSLLQPSYLHGHFELGGEENCCWGGGEGCGWWGHVWRCKMLRCGICQHIVPAVPWKHHGKPFYFCHFRLSQRVPYRPRVKLLPRRRTRRRTDM